VFGNLRGNKRLHRFTLRGKTKVDGQWKLGQGVIGSRGQVFDL